MIQVRPERGEDRAAVSEVLRRAFGQEEEPRLVDALRDAGKAAVSLVAENDGAVVGCIVFSPVTIEDNGAVHNGLGLGPVAVLPGFQGLGIGTKLMEEGLKACAGEGHDRVVVIGHPEYYPRFGFVPASRFGLRCTYDVPDNVFMACVLREGAFDGVKGLVRYAPEFDSTA